ncbi:hypothetical protein ELE38_29855 [Klebsiella pneumoniae]|nr:hypothetical protein [Klebsiella pneumoniae]
MFRKKGRHARWRIKTGVFVLYPSPNRCSDYHHHLKDGPDQNYRTKCSESGIWKVAGTPSTTAPITKGNVMPPYRGKGVTWKLPQYA